MIDGAAVDNVDRLVAQAEEEAGNNVWVRSALKTLSRYARRRDRQRMSKEAMYMSRKMSHRLADHDEDSQMYVREMEMDKASFLQKNWRRADVLIDKDRLHS